MAHRQVSANIPEEIYQQGKLSGMRWGALIGFGLEIRDLKVENRILKDQLGQLQRARDKLQAALLERGD